MSGSGSGAQRIRGGTFDGCLHAALGDAAGRSASMRRGARKPVAYSILFQ